MPLQNQVTEADIQTHFSAEERRFIDTYIPALSSRGGFNFVEYLTDMRLDIDAFAAGELTPIAGDGLAVNGTALEVQVDDTGIEIAADTLQLKDLGVTDAKLAADVKVGSLAALTTTAQNNIVAAINELDGEAATDAGSIASARLAMPNQPLANDTIDIGGDTYEFDGVGGNINVVIGGSAAATRGNLITAINTNGTESVFADEVGTSVQIQLADAPGGTPTVGTASLVLQEAITDAADVWNQADIDDAGGYAGPKSMAFFVVDISNENLATDFAMLTTFTVDDVLWTAYDATGALKATTATLTATGQSVVVDADAGGSPLVATDVIFAIAVS